MSKNLRRIIRNTFDSIYRGSGLTKRKVPELCKDVSECCGCAACYAICPRSAISMVSDEYGYLIPKINEKRCVRCGLCIQVCAFKQGLSEK